MQIKSQNLCRNVLKAIRVNDLPPLENYPKADRVTFRYYLGRLYFLEEQYIKVCLNNEIVAIQNLSSHKHILRLNKSFQWHFENAPLGAPVTNSKIQYHLSSICTGLTL